MTNFIKTTTTNKLDIGAVIEYISHVLHRLVAKGSDVSFRVSHYIPEDVDWSTRGRYLDNLYVVFEVKLKQLNTIYTSQPIYVCAERKDHTEASLNTNVANALQRAITELKSSSRNDLVKSLNDGVEFFKSLGSRPL